MDTLTLQPIRRVEGEVVLPGSKSLSNRYLLLAALARGDSTVHNLLDSDDTRRMVEALRKLGVSLRLSEDWRQCTVQGAGGPLPAQGAELDLGLAGTAIRPLCAALCLGRGEFLLSGDPRMLERPIGDLVDALRQLGADIRYLGSDGYPPLRIRAGGLRGGRVSVRGDVSSQFLTALLMAAPMVREDVAIQVLGDLVSKPYIDMTLDSMRRFGVETQREGYARFRVPGGQQYVSPGDVLVEGDASSATYFLAAAAIRGGTVRVTGVGRDSIQGDVEFARILERMGAAVRWGFDWIQVSCGDLRGLDLDMARIPDAAMTLAATALFANGKTAIRNIGNWRVKESDRLAAMAAELRKVGADVVEGPDFLEVTPPERIRPAAIATYNDHRMAMCFSLAALGDAEIAIENPGVVSKTFPEYWEKFRSITQA